VRDAEGGETTPSFGHPSNVRRGEGGTAFGRQLAKMPSKGLLSNLPIYLLIGGKGGAPPTLPNELHEAYRSGASKAGTCPLFLKFIGKPLRS